MILSQIDRMPSRYSLRARVQEMDIAQAKKLSNIYMYDILGQHGYGGNVEIAVLRVLTLWIQTFIVICT